MSEKLSAYMGGADGWIYVRKLLSKKKDGSRRGGYQGNTKECAQAMEIDWMTRREMTQAIPPAYTEYIGRELLAQLKQRQEG